MDGTTEKYMPKEKYIPASALHMAIVMVNAADQCDQAGNWGREHRNACRHILEWMNSEDYAVTCAKANAATDVISIREARLRQERTGQWYEVRRFCENGVEMALYECTCCGHKIERRRRYVPPYCESCGASMKGIEYRHLGVR